MNNAIKILMGMLALGAAWLFVFRAGFVFQINAWLRENVFSDKWILFAGRRVAILLIVLGIVALFSGIQGIVKNQTIRPQIAAAMLDQARSDFRDRDYSRVVRQCKLLVRSDPQNVEALALMTEALWALGDKKYASQTRDTLIRLEPDHPLGRKIPSAAELSASLQ